MGREWLITAFRKHREVLLTNPPGAGQRLYYKLFGHLQDAIFVLDAQTDPERVRSVTCQAGTWIWDRRAFTGSITSAFELGFRRCKIQF